MDNDMLIKLFLNTISKMDEEELKNSLTKAKTLLSASDYDKLLNLIDEKKKLL